VSKPADAWTVSAQLYAEPSGIHILHGPGEIHAHLDHLTRTGDVVQTTTWYVIADETN
jgi:hypothetical protein